MKDYIPINQMELSNQLNLLEQPFDHRIAEKEVKISLSAREHGVLHGTWQIEQMMLSYIRGGDLQGILRLFRTLAKQESMNVGVLAETPLRQEKNLFIGLVALIGKTAAIEGGMDIEDAYRLVDVYSQECEKAPSVDEVYALRYNMVLEFTKRVQQCKLPQDLSRDVVRALHYINENIYGNISLDEIAAEAGVSRATLTRHFRAQMAQSIVTYVTEAKIKEAKRLLLYSDMTISEIAATLNFSSQPYFQTIFKKVTGQTPLEYQRR